MSITSTAPNVRCSAPRPMFGIVLMVFAMLVIPIMDVIAKHLSAGFHTGQLVWARYLFHLTLFVPFVVWRYGRRVFQPTRPWLQIMRGGIQVATTALFFAGVALMPVADAIAVVFIYPFIVTMLGALVLGERVGAWRWAAVVCGFAGALLIIRPGMATMSAGVPFVLGAGVMHASFLVLTRKLSGSEPPLVTLSLTGLIGGALASGFVPFVWVTPTEIEWGLMLAMGLIAVTAHLLIIYAHEHASASKLAPIGYVEIVAATLFGFIVFGDFPDLITWAGIAIVIASGIVIVWREQRVKASIPLEDGGKIATPLPPLPDAILGHRRGR